MACECAAPRGARKYGASDRANKDRPGPSYPHCKVVSDVRTNLRQTVVLRTAASAAPPKSMNCRPSPRLSLSSAATKCWLSEASGETSVRREQRQCCETEHKRTEANPAYKLRGGYFGDLKTVFIAFGIIYLFWPSDDAYFLLHQSKRYSILFLLRT